MRLSDAALSENFPAPISWSATNSVIMESIIMPQQHLDLFQPRFPVTKVSIKSIEGEKRTACLNAAWSINAIGADGREESLGIVPKSEIARLAVHRIEGDRHSICNRDGFSVNVVDQQGVEEHIAFIPSYPFGL